MPDKIVGALTIGQSPRPDLLHPLRDFLSEGFSIAEAGALDGLSPEEVPPVHEAIYPLTTRLLDGSRIKVEESFLLPRLQEALNRLEDQGVLASILLCAGTFAGLGGRRPFIKPFDTARRHLQAGKFKRLGFIAPMPEQENPIRQRWQAAGFEPVVWTADIVKADRAFSQTLHRQIKMERLECIVLDYVGHPAQKVERLQEISPIPVFDLGRMAMNALAQIVA